MVVGPYHPSLKLFSRVSIIWSSSLLEAYPSRKVGFLPRFSVRRPLLWYPGAEAGARSKLGPPLLWYPGAESGFKLGLGGAVLGELASHLLGGDRRGA